VAALEATPSAFSWTWEELRLFPSTATPDSGAVFHVIKPSKINKLQNSSKKNKKEAKSLDAASGGAYKPSASTDEESKGPESH
jgi:hypothetical protein